MNYIGSKNRPSLLLLGFLLFTVQSFAGTIKTDSTSTDNQNAYKIGLNYGTSLQQNGRKATSNEAFVHPSLQFTHTSGLSLEVSGILMPSAKKKMLDDVALSVGYDKDFGDHLSCGVEYSYSRYFTTKQLTSSQPHNITVNAMWYNSIVTPSLYITEGLGSSDDITFNFDLMHLFIIKHIISNKDKLTIPVIASVYAGTTNYYLDYLTKNSGTKPEIGRAHV